MFKWYAMCVCSEVVQLQLQSIPINTEVPTTLKHLVNINTLH